MSKGHRWLFIVRPDQEHLYAQLRRAFEGVDLVDVVVDRRRADRRREDRPVDVDRRRTERRVPLTKAEEQLWEIAGFRLVYRDEDVTIFRAPDDPSSED
ncbi:MAG TPA: hypothetical protein VGW35_27440 [Methylomirabilota bacterium]|nr:hypothetical protein [Methylomirabilota bacterium]